MARRSREPRFFQLCGLGRDAFKALGEFKDRAQFDEAFAEHQAGIRTLAEALHEDGQRFTYTNVRGAQWKPDFLKSESITILEGYWQLTDTEEKLQGPLASHFLFACLEEIDTALIGLALDSDHVGAVMAAVTAFGNFQAILSGNTVLREMRSEQASRAAIERYSRDAKQAAKKCVFECWERWQQNPVSYAGQAAFARDMLEKYTELTSQKKIEDWCRDWKRSAK